MNKVHITLRLPKDVHVAIVNVAKKEDRSMNKQIVYALRQWLGGRGDSSKSEQHIKKGDRS